ncbi:MAG TPA: SRPBCC family protein [Bacteroidia bacterium]|nr:SRPBCC family protein [Bacteroidia bacterium]
MPTETFHTTPEREIVSSRIFDVNRATLFRAWSEPKHLKNWWGPNGFTNTFHEFDFRVGGIWRFTMHGPDKGHYQNECEFIQIEAPALIAWKRHSKPLFQVLATFEDLSAQKTKLVFKMLFETEEDCRKVKPFATSKNEENFDRLEFELKQMDVRPN